MRLHLVSIICLVTVQFFLERKDFFISTILFQYYPSQIFLYFTILPSQALILFEGSFNIIFLTLISLLFDS